MRRKFLVPAVKKLLKSVYIYGSYRKNNTGIAFLDHPVYTHPEWNFGTIGKWGRNGKG